MIYDRVWSTPLFPPRPRRGMMRWKFSNFRKWSPKWDKAETPAVDVTEREKERRRGKLRSNKSDSLLSCWGFSHFFLPIFWFIFHPIRWRLSHNLGLLTAWVAAGHGNWYDDEDIRNVHFLKHVFYLTLTCRNCQFLDVKNVILQHTQ